MNILKRLYSCMALYCQEFSENPQNKSNMMNHLNELSKNVWILHFYWLMKNYGHYKIVTDVFLYSASIIFCLFNGDYFAHNTTSVFKT